jgi:sarcosine oxidase
MARRALGAAIEELPFPLAPMKPYAFREPQVLGAGLAMRYWRMLDQREARRG